MAINSGSMATSTVAAPLAAGPCRNVTVHNDDAAILLKIGNSTAQNFTLGPGQSVLLQVGNRNMVYVKSASATPTLTWISD